MQHAKSFKAIDRIRRGFLWRGRKDAKGGHCLVAWTKVCLPRELGGFGISNLQILGWTLRARWLWLKKKKNPIRPWTNFHVQVHPCVEATPRPMEWSWRFYIENWRFYEDEDSTSTWRIITLKKIEDFKIILPYALYRKVFTLSAFNDSTLLSCVLVCFRLRTLSC